MARSERWLNGVSYKPGADSAVVGPYSRCVGCGNGLAVIAAFVRGPNSPEPPEPDWPFSHHECPICQARDHADRVAALLEQARFEPRRVDPPAIGTAEPDTWPRGRTRPLP